MGRTVYGVDLEESPFGGLIEKLLTEEELEKLADGGAPARPGGRGPAPDGGDDSGDEGGDADSESDDADDDGDWTVSDDTYGSSGDADEETDADAGDVGGDAGSESADAESWSPSSPPPSTAPDDGHDFGSESGYAGATGFGAGLTGSDGEDDGGSFLSKHKWLLLKVAVGLAALATVALVLWRFKDRLAGVVPGRGGDDGADEFDVDSPGVDDPADVSPARRRAKAGESAPDSDEDGTTGERDEGVEERPRRPPRGEPVESVETPGQDLDLGALVGLGVLAFVAALVRKYDEERNRPHDPLVDGPRDDDVADDDQ